MELFLFESVSASNLSVTPEMFELLPGYERLMGDLWPLEGLGLEVRPSADLMFCCCSAVFASELEIKAVLFFLSLFSGTLVSREPCGRMPIFELTN